MQKKLNCIVLIFLTVNLSAQVGINTFTPDTSSALDVFSKDAGVLVPRMTTLERDAINNPANALLIYNIDEDAFEYYSNSAWILLKSQESCGFVSLPKQFNISMDLGASESITLDLQTTLGTPGAITTTKIFESPGFDITLNNVSNNGNSPPTSQTITFTLENSSTVSSGSVGQVIFQSLANCGEITYTTVNITVTGCDFDVIPDRIKANIPKPTSGSVNIPFTLNITQQGSIPSAINSIFTTTGHTGLIFNSSSGCTYPCSTNVSVDVTSSAMPGTYTYNVVAQANCGTSKNFTLTVSVENNPRDCKQILADNPSATSGVYQIDPDGFGNIGLIDCYCDMSTDGGGWTLILNYNHLANTNPNNQPRSSALPLLGSTSLGIDESNTPFWGHTSTALLNNFSFNEVRFYGATSGHSRILHFKIAQPAMVNYFKTGIGGVDLADLRNNFVPFANHTANLPFVAAARVTNQGDNAMLNRPFYRNNNSDWRIARGNDWEMDDNPNDPRNNTIHQVWIR